MQRKSQPEARPPPVCRRLGSATAIGGGSAGARSAASERLGDIAINAFRDRSTFFGRSSVATVEKSRLGVNEASDLGN